MFLEEDNFGLYLNS